MMCLLVFEFVTLVCFGSFSRASDYGLVNIDRSGRVVHFYEKPTGIDLKSMVIFFFFLSPNKNEYYVLLLFDTVVMLDAAK